VPSPTEADLDHLFRALSSSNWCPVGDADEAGALNTRRACTASRRLSLVRDARRSQKSASPTRLPWCAVRPIRRVGAVPCATTLLSSACLDSNGLPRVRGVRRPTRHPVSMLGLRPSTRPVALFVRGHITDGRPANRCSQSRRAAQQHRHDVERRLVPWGLPRSPRAARRRVLECGDRYHQCAISNPAESAPFLTSSRATSSWARPGSLRAPAAPRAAGSTHPERLAG